MGRRSIRKRIVLGMLSAMALTMTACGVKPAADTESSADADHARIQGVIEELSSEPEHDITLDRNLSSEAPEPFTMLFTGDVLFQDNIISAYERNGLNGILSQELQEEMQNADMTMINEEFPFGVGGEKAPDKQYTFKADPSYVTVFHEMGVDLVSLANNHVLDFGQDVLSQTFVTLDEAEIPYVGAGETQERAMAWESFDLKGTKVGVLCASRVIPVVEWDVRNCQPGVFTTYDPTLLVEQIGKAKQENDLVVVYVHWGIEKAETPEAYQRELAHAYIDAGADLVVGAHPHVLQGIEFYEGVPIVYSLGNYMFHPTIDKTAVLKANVDADRNLSIQLIPAAAANSQTAALSGDAANELYRYMESISFDVEIDEQGIVSPK